LLKIDREGNIVFQKGMVVGFDDNITSMALTADGGFILCGTSEINGWYYKIWIVKFNNNGSIQWQKSYTRGQSEYNPSIAPTPDRGFLLAAESYTFGWESRLWVLKLNSDGNIIWQKLFLFSVDANIRAIIDKKGDYLIASTYYDENYHSDIFLMKIDKNKNTLWKKRFGGKYDDYFRTIINTSDNSLLIAGETYSFGAGSSDILLIKSNYSGSISEKCLYESKAEISERGTNGEAKIINAWVASIRVNSSNTNYKISEYNLSTITLCAGGPSFWIKCNPDYLPYLLRLSDCAAYSFLNFSGAISFSCSNLPSGADCIFSPSNIVISPGSSASTRLGVKLNQFLAPGLYNFDVIATSGNIKRSYPMRFKVNR